MSLSFHDSASGNKKLSTWLHHWLLFVSVTTYIWGLSKPTVTTKPPVWLLTFCFSRLVWKGKHAAFSLPALHTLLLSTHSCFYNLQANVFYLHPILSTEDAAHLWQTPIQVWGCFFSVQLFSPHCFCIRSSRRIYGWLAPLGEQSPASRNIAHVKAQTLWKLWFDPDSWHMVSGHLWFCDFLNESLRKALNSKKNNLYHHLQLCAQMYNNAGQFRYPY